jgi:hypothetical protein
MARMHAKDPDYPAWETARDVVGSFFRPQFKRIVARRPRLLVSAEYSRHSRKFE